MPKSERPATARRGQAGWSVVAGVAMTVTRHGFYAALALFAVAVAVGRSSGTTGLEHQAVPSLALRVALADRPTLVDALWWQDPDAPPRAFDAASETWHDPGFPSSDVVGRGSVSPWSDTRGRALVAAQWLSRDSRAEGRIGLAFYGYPSGEVVARAPAEVQVAGVPCWFPDNSTRVLFPGGDGQLYRVELRDDDGTPTTTAPRPLAWVAERPGPNLMVREITWPTDPVWGGRLVATIDYQSRLPGGKKGYVGSQVWWLELDPAGTVVRRAGRLTHPGAGPLRVDEEHFPTLANLPGVGPTLAYLARYNEESPWHVRVVALEAGPGDAPLVARPESTRMLASGCAFTAPVLRPDGRSVYVLMDPLSASAHMARYPLSLADGSVALASSVVPAAPPRRATSPVPPARAGGFAVWLLGGHRS